MRPTRPCTSIFAGPLRDSPRDGYFLRAESFYNVSSAVEDYDMKEFYGGESLHVQSHGESFMSLVLHRLRGKGLYFFDEPERRCRRPGSSASLSRCTS